MGIQGSTSALGAWLTSVPCILPVLVVIDEGRDEESQWTIHSVKTCQTALRVGSCWRLDAGGKLEVRRSRDPLTKDRRKLKSGRYRRRVEAPATVMLVFFRRRAPATTAPLGACAGSPMRNGWVRKIAGPPHFCHACFLPPHANKGAVHMWVWKLR